MNPEDNDFEQLGHVLVKVYEEVNFSMVQREKLNLVLCFTEYVTENNERNCFCQLTGECNLSFSLEATLLPLLGNIVWLLIFKIVKKKR